MRFFDNILKNNENKNIYEESLNYNLLTPYTNELSKKLLDLLRYKNKKSFKELIKFMLENPDSFYIIHSFYPYNNIDLKSGELKFANYYIYLLSHLFTKKFNFSVRFGNNRYNIQFPEQDQNKRVTPYFILNEKKSLLLSSNSFIKLNLKNKNDNNYNFQFSYIEDPTEENTKNMIQWIFNNYNSLFKESPLNTFEEIDEIRLESYNFFSSNYSSLINRIWSLLINLSDKYSFVIKYLKESFCFLERDSMEIFQCIYDKLDINHLDNLIRNISTLSFFCDSESILWKYRDIINKNEKDENEHFAQYLKTKNINYDEEISLIEKEKKKNLNKLSIYWDEMKIDYYKSQLLILQNILITFKNKDIEDAKVTSLRKNASILSIKLDKIKNNNSSIKSLNFLKDEISKFIKMNKPTKKLLKKLENKVNVFIDLIGKGNNRNDDIIYLPNNNDIKLIDIKENKKYQLYKFIF